MTTALAHGHYDPSEALALFRGGMNTAEIASLFNIHESEALRLVCKQRSAVLNRPSPYPDISARNLSVRILRQSSGGC